MSWAALFGFANLWALVMWVVLIAMPRKKLALAAVMYAGVGLLCLAYAALLVLLVTGTLSGGGPGGGRGASFTTIEGVRAIFATDGGVTVGWIHYLALDLFAGLWIARDADAKRFSRLVQAPILLLTFLAGPFGLGIWLLVRERRARAVGNRRGIS
ncbi:abscisic acid-deficient protein Aba4 family protein [Aurantiacibacter luteus]|uniref:Membrane protein n=1 Tax=Aurantiacibacter luteus TaxID=1581420 RepID=A0A0G9MX00_9SPHN|nr:abscisic acid-deficient protein Aba4 family protein [Aurantiacibacter luteus]KLE35215.1 membrane protein [Aurantiacibacter luteus]